MTKAKRPADPVEAVIFYGLKKAGLEFTYGHRTKSNFDFHLTGRGVFIEVCRFHTPRKIRQMEGAENVILIQGLDAARVFCSLLGVSK